MELCRIFSSETSDRCNYCDETTCSDNQHEGICPDCQSMIAKTVDFVRAEEIQWATLTPRGSRWMKSCSLNSYISKFEGADISYYLSMYISPADEELIGKDVMTGRTDPTVFSIELQHIFTGKLSRDPLERVLRAYCAKSSGIGYCQGLNYVAAWLLLFLDENSAFWMLSYLVDKWLLPDFYIGNKRGNSLNGFFIESSVISAFVSRLVPSVKKFHQTRDFCDLFSLQLLIQLFIDKTSLETTAFLWDKLMSEGSIALIRGTVSLLMSEEESINEGEHPFRILKKLIYKENLSVVKKFYEDSKQEITDRRVQRLRRQATAYRAKQWQTNNRMIVNRLEKYSEFTRGEIERLQIEFTEFIRGRDHQISTKSFGNDTMNISWIDGHTVDVGINRNEFLQIMKNISINMDEHAPALFDEFDDDRSGFLDFRELMMCLSILTRGTFQDKLKLCFDSYDFNHSGYLKKTEAQCLVDALLKPLRREYEINYDSKLREDIGLVQNSIMNLVCRERNMLSFFDFHNAVMSNPLLYTLFNTRLDVPVKHLGSVFNHKKVQQQKTCYSSCIVF